jgi:hypothetical protein
MTLSRDHKFQTPDQLKGRKYCKFCFKIGYTTNSCIRFRDLIQQAINNVGLKFEEKELALKVDFDPFPQEDNYVKPITFEINTVDISSAYKPTDVNYILG